MKTIQNITVVFNKEIESLKKTKIEIKLEMRNSGNQTKPSEVSLTNRLRDTEERISELEDQLSQTKKMLNLKQTNKNQAQNIQKIWGTMKRPNLLVIGIE